MNILLIFLCLFFYVPISSQLFQEEGSIFYIKDAIVYTSKDLSQKTESSESLIFVDKNAILSNKENITGKIVYASPSSALKKRKRKKTVKQTILIPASSEKKTRPLPAKNNGKTFIWNQNETHFFSFSHLGKNITVIQDAPVSKKAITSSTHKYAISGKATVLNNYHSQTWKLYLQNKSLYIRPPPMANNSL